MVLGHSLRDNGTKKRLVALVTLDSVQVSTLDALKVHLNILHVGKNADR